MPDVHIAAELRRGVFVIAGGRARGKVSWQVTGVRRDHWAKSNPLKVEQLKSDFVPIPEAVDIKAFALQAKKEAELAKKGIERERELTRRTQPTAKRSPAGRPKSQGVKERDAYVKNATKTVRKLVAAAARVRPST
jgi:hypothetical protein